MKNKLEDKMDIVDAVEDIKAQIAFMRHACTAMMAEEGQGLDQHIVSGMYTIFGFIEEQAGEVSEALQKNLHDATEKEKADSPTDDIIILPERARRGFHFGERVRPVVN